MAFTLGSLTFSGTHDVYGRPQFGPFVAPVQRTKFAGAKGEIELNDKIGGRQIVVPYRVGETSESALFTTLQDLSEKAGQVHGTLTVDSLTFANVTFVGFQPQEHPRPVAGAGLMTWMQRGMLVFYQLTTAE